MLLILFGIFFRLPIQVDTNPVIDKDTGYQIISRFTLSRENLHLHEEGIDAIKFMADCDFNLGNDFFLLMLITS
jgi:hypothetical protein